MNLAALVVGIIVVAPSVGWSQSTGTVNEALEQQYEEAFQVLFQDPGNLEKTFKFAELAVEIGNFESAISSLERMLLVNPDLPGFAWNWECFISGSVHTRLPRRI